MTTPTQAPSPADMPRAGLSRAEALRRRGSSGGLIDDLEAQRRRAEADGAVAGLLAPPGSLAQLAAQQGVDPVTDPDDLASPDPIPADDDAFDTALRDDEPEPTTHPTPAPHPVPAPPFAWVPGAARQPNPMARDQYIRRGALDLAVRHFQDLEVEPAEVLATAKTWAEWIRVGDRGDRSADT